MKILIVDDEKLICSGLKTLTEHLDLPEVESVHTCTNPVEAIRLIRSLQPDIVLTDVKMPAMSGLELMERVASETPSTRFVVISGYDDFDLVRQALKLRAADYLLKPATTDELRAALTRSIDAALEDRERERVQHALIASAVERISRGDVPSAPRLEVLAQSVSDLLVGDYYQLAIVEVESRHVRPSPSEVALTVGERCSDHSVEVIDVPTDQGAVFLFVAAEQQSGLDSVHAELRRLCGSAVGGRLVATLSSRSRSLELLPVLFREASEARRQKILRPEPILCFEDVERPRPLSQGAAAELERFDGILRSSELDAAGDYIAELPDSPWMSVAFLDELRALLSRRVEYAPRPLEAYFRLRDFLTDASAGIRQDATPTPHDGGGARDAALVAEARRYVLSDLARNADLASVARHVGLSYAYFSTVFKDTAAVAFSDFVRQARMEEASRLLRTGHPRVTEVAQRVGYHYPKHFTRAFKRYFGVSPREYAATNHPHQENYDETD